MFSGRGSGGHPLKPPPEGSSPLDSPGTGRVEGRAPRLESLGYVKAFGYVGEEMKRYRGLKTAASGGTGGRAEALPYVDHVDPTFG
jgi:hypothetical protein